MAHSFKVEHAPDGVPVGLAQVRTPALKGVRKGTLYTELERQAVERLRDRAGWWKGDENALLVLRDFADAIRSNTPYLRPQS